MKISLVLFSFFSGLAGAWCVVRFGGRAGLNDIPNHRSSHSTGIPKGAGIGILAAVAGTAWTLSVPWWLWGPAAGMSITGLWGGDRQGLGAFPRLALHFFFALVFLAGLLQSGRSGLLSVFLCIPFALFIAGTANFYNFMDGIDGIAGISAMAGFSLVWAYAVMTGQKGPVVGICPAVVFSCLGFLWFNLPRARVFLGDTGSLLLGFLFSVLVIMLARNLLDFFVMAGFLAPFYYDEFFSIGIRLRQGQSLLLPHRSHTYQILANELKVSHWKVASGYGMLQLLIGLSGICAASLGLGAVLAVYLWFGLMFFLFSSLIRKMAGVQ